MADFPLIYEFDTGTLAKATADLRATSSLNENLIDRLPRENSRHRLGERTRTRRRKNPQKVGARGGFPYTPVMSGDFPFLITYEKAFYD